jgi:hypothetical protein
MRSEDDLYLVSDTERIAAARLAAELLRDSMEARSVIAATSACLTSRICAVPKWWRHLADSAGGIHSEVVTT